MVGAAKAELGGGERNKVEGGEGKNGRRGESKNGRSLKGRVRREKEEIGVHMSCY